MSEAPNFSAEAGTPGGDPSQSDLLDKFARWDLALTEHWSKWIEESKALYDFVAGHQWTDEEVSEMAGSGKIPVTFNLVDPVLSAVQGAEISNRQAVQYYPRTADDTGISDALTQGAQYINDECDGDQEDSEAFWDALVCGMGWTETRPDVNGSDVDIIKERVDPLQMRVDPASRKRCAEDARYLKREHPMSEDEFNDFREEIGRPDLQEGELDGGLDAGKRRTVVNPRQRYTNGLLGEGAGETVVVNEWQWWEREPSYLCAVPKQDDPSQVELKKLDQETFDKIKAIDPNIKHTKATVRCYYRAFATANEVLFHEKLEEETFRYKCMTGKRDRNRGTWFGLARAMMDPCKFTNKLYSEVLHIIRTNANGGMALETDAVDDVRQFEDSWAATDKITWLKPGSLSGAHGQKMMPKNPPAVQPALFQLMEFAKDMVKATTGVNEEILGLVQREQAGVLEAQRKQAAYGILSAFFDAKRRYQREQGKLLLAMIRLYVPADKLVRIVDKGTAAYVSLALQVTAEKYDIVVDEAPASPDQKAKVWAILQPLLPQLIEGNLITPETLADVVEYLDLPAAVSAKLAAAIRGQAANASQPDPAVEADTNLKNAKARHADAAAQASEAHAFKQITEAHVQHVGLGANFLQSTTRPDPRDAQGGGDQPPAGGPPQDQQQPPQGAPADAGPPQDGADA